MFTRYAIYDTPPPDTALAKFGANWLGWDSAQGTARAHPVLDGIDVAQITQRPRKYGFHGTIKPPFRLAEGTTAQGLSDALSDLCTQLKPVTLDGLQLARLGRFFALVPAGDADALGAMAARVVQDLDGFRAAPNAAELEKRRSARLIPSQEAHLLRWGYPYVLDQFRFHMTLTGPLKGDLAAQAETALDEQLAALDLAPYTITDLTLLGEDEDGKFHQIHRYPLTG